MVNPNPAYTPITLAGLSVPTNVEPQLRKFLSGVKQHLELAHGSSSGASKERFVTLEELRRAGLIEVAVKRGRAEIVRTAETSASNVEAPDSTGSDSDFPYLNTPIARQGWVLRFMETEAKWMPVPFFDEFDNIQLADSRHIYLGTGVTGDKFDLYHDGANTYLTDNTGSLFISTAGEVDVTATLLDVHTETRIDIPVSVAGTYYPVLTLHASTTIGGLQVQFQDGAPTGDDLQVNLGFWASGTAPDFPPNAAARGFQIQSIGHGTNPSDFILKSFHNSSSGTTIFTGESNRAALQFVAGTLADPSLCIGDWTTGFYHTATALNASQRLRTIDGTAAAPAFSFSNEGDVGIYRVGNNVLGFATGGALRMQISGLTISFFLKAVTVAGDATNCGLVISTVGNGFFAPGTDQVALATGATARLTASTTAFTATLPWRGQDGSNTAPAFSFSADSNTGFYRVGTDSIGATAGGVLQIQVGTAQTELLAGHDLWIRDAGFLRIYDSTDTDYGQFSHDGTNFITAFTNTTSWVWTGITDLTIPTGFTITTGGGTLTIAGTGETLATFADDGAVVLYHNNTIRIQTSANGVEIPGGSSLRIQDAANTDYAQFSHDGTDFNTSLVNTAVWNIDRPLQVGGAQSRFTGALAAVGAGLGVEIGTVGGTTGFILAYNRTTAAYAPLLLEADSIVFNTSGGIEAGRFTASGTLQLTGDVGASGYAALPGLEMGYAISNAAAFFQGYNRNTLAYVPLLFVGSEIRVGINGSTELSVAQDGSFATVISSVTTALRLTPASTKQVQIYRSGEAAPLVIYDGSGADYGQQSHDGTDYLFSFGTTRHLAFSGLTGTYIFDRPIRLRGFTVATLPAGTTGDTAYVTDANAPTFGSTVAGGGAAVTQVFYNGTNWIVG